MKLFVIHEYDSPRLVRLGREQSAFAMQRGLAGPRQEKQEDAQVRLNR